MKTQNKKLNANKNTAMQIVVSLSALFFAESVLASQSNDWLAVERMPVIEQTDRIETALRSFDDSVSTIAATSRDVRSMMNGSDTEYNSAVSDLETTVEIPAKTWIASLPQPSQKMIAGHATKQMNTECQLNFGNGNYECASWSAVRQAAAQPQVTILAPVAQVEEPAQKELSDDAITRMLGVPVQPQAKQTTAQTKIRTLKFFRGAAGLVTTEGGKISLRDPQEVVAIQMAPEVKSKHISMFVRDPSLLAYDAATNRLRALNTGNTELFVVSQDRISIIPVTVSPATIGAVAANTQTKAKHKIPAATDLEMPSSLASVDVLDHAAGVHATFAGLSQSSDTTNNRRGPKAEDLQVPAEITSLASTADDGTVSFVRAKAKATFGRMMIRVVDERSQWDGSSTYPVGGVRVRLVGTEFESKTDGQGFLEISDMPAGARVFAEIFANNGSTMPGFAEIVFDPSAVNKEHAQVIMVRRYLSLDYAARMANVVQNMENSSLCATVLDSSAHRKPVAGVRLRANKSSIGPFYFNDLGYLDTRMPTTGANGRVCFFNVDPGAVALGIQKEDHTVQAAVLMTARGRHSEETIGLDDARHLTTTVASVATASDQLSSDVDRANKYLSVEQAEVAVVGGKDQMVPIDEGVYTSGNPVLPIRGRVWTVAESSDFETSLQASSIKLPGSRQITSLLPRGFVDDMANYAQQSQDPDLATVVVEHAAIAGQGSESVKIRLVDPSGHDVGDGWYFADAPTAKAVFFNVPAGVYSVVVETASGHWLAADTLMADPETSTYVRTGAPLEKHLTTTSAAN